MKKIDLLRLSIFPGKFQNFSEAAARGVLWEKLLLKISQYSKEKCRPPTLLKQTPAQVFSSEYCKIFKNT